MMERAEVLTHVMQRHSCVVMIEGGVKCWGYLQLGDDSSDSLRHFCYNNDDPRCSSLTPLSVVGLSSGVVSVSVGHVR